MKIRLKESLVILTIFFAAFLLNPLSAQSAEQPKDKGFKPSGMYSVDRDNGDGTYTVEIYGSPINYLDDGKWNPINTAITKIGDVYGVEAGIYKAYFYDDHVEVVMDSGTTEIYFLETSDTSHGETTLDIDENRATYRNGVDVEYVYTESGLKQNVILTETPEIEDRYYYTMSKVVFDQTVSAYVGGERMPSSFPTNKSVTFKNEKDETIFQLPTPVAFELNNTENLITIDYQVQVLLNVAYISVRTPYSWLSNEERDYPVVIDPTTTIQPAQIDTFLYTHTADQNWGSNATLKTRGYSSSSYKMRSIIKFDIAGNIPAGSIITSVKLYLYYSRYLYDTEDATIDIHKIQQSPARDWVESEATWNSYKTGSSWTSAGGDYSGTVSASKVIPYSPYGWIEWASSQLASDVQDFFDNPSTNYGWILKDSNENTGYNTFREFKSRNYAIDLTQRPKLEVTYATLPDHIITATAGFGGSISPSGTVVVSQGASQDFLIIPDPGNSIEDVLVDGISQGAIASYTFTNVITDHYITAVFDLPVECSDLSSVPLSAIKHAAPPNIMFVLDDSGSMDWEFLTEDTDGKFQDYEYVFDNPGDNVYAGDILNGRNRKKWKSQWSGYNRLYYDPSVDYEPWPTLNEADPDTPRSHPTNATPTFALNDTYYRFDHGIVIDDLDAGFSKAGTWTAVLNHHESYDNHFWECSSDATLHTATWTPTLPAGDYDVFAWWSSADHYSAAVSYTINYAGIPDIVPVNQRIDERQWNRLGAGSYHFDGISGDVSLSNTPNFFSDRACADAVKFVPAGVTPIDIKNAHYYVWSATENKPYLVIVDGGTITYYAVTGITGTDPYEEVTQLTLDTTPPHDVVPKKAGGTARTYTEERQNFANWYSFYRRRGLTATAAVANAIVNMQGVNVGLYSINQSLIQPVLRVKAGGENETATLLDSLYNLTLVGDT